MNNEYLLKQVYDTLLNNNKNLLNIWLTHILWSWRWWLEVLLAIVPWIVWVKIVDRKQIVRLLFIGLVVALITDVLDMFGICFGLWYYEWKVLPLTIIYIPWNFALFPVSIMLLLQFKPDLSKYIKAAGFAFFAAFVSEPFFAWIGIYIMKNWKHWYSFVIYVFLFLLYDKIYNSKLLEQCGNK